jgi:hypothetical protein
MIMELKDFIERFANKKLIINGETETYDVVCYFKDNFPEALENFVNRICEKQKAKCANLDLRKHAAVLFVEQPKIEEL